MQTHHYAAATGRCVRPMLSAATVLLQSGSASALASFGGLRAYAASEPPLSFATSVCFETVL